MRILRRKFYAHKSKNRRKNTPDLAFPRTLLSIISQDIDIERISFLPINHTSNSAENWQKMLCDNPKLGIVNNNMYAKYDPNPSILSQDIEQKPILGIKQGPLTLLKWIWDLCANNMHIFRPWPNHLWSFKTIGLKLQEELRSRNTHWL